MAELDILKRVEVTEGKRPYFRYSLNRQQIVMEIDLTRIEKKSSGETNLSKIRERHNAGARFTTARGGQAISSVIIWTGEGRERKESRINLTSPQGRFLFHLPFPDGRPLSIKEIMLKAGVDDANLSEILDLVDILDKHNVIESC